MSVGIGASARDPVLDADGHNKPRKRRGVFSADISRLLTGRIGQRVVAYRYRGMYRGVIEDDDIIYVFVEGSRARFTVRKRPFYSTDDDDWTEVTARKIEKHLTAVEYSSAELRDARTQLVRIFDWFYKETDEVLHEFQGP